MELVYHQFNAQGIRSARVRSESEPNHPHFQAKLPDDSPYNYYDGEKLWVREYVEITPAVEVAGVEVAAAVNGWIVNPTFQPLEI